MSTLENVVALSGATRVIAILGYPVKHSLSPAMHNAEFARLGLDYVYVPAEVDPSNLGEAAKGLKALNLAGCNATIPHKTAIMQYLDEVTEEAQEVGAVNTVVCKNGRTIGYNTDITGWVDDIQQDILLDRSHVGILGVGGAARALAVGAIRAGAARVFLCGRREETVRPLAEKLISMYGEEKISFGLMTDGVCQKQIESCDILVNATPVGMESHPGIPIPAQWLDEHHYVYDTIYVPPETELIRQARERGCAVRNGLGMLARQGATAFELWTGTKPDVERMMNTLRTHLNRD